MKNILYYCCTKRFSCDILLKRQLNIYQMQVQVVLTTSHHINMLLKKLPHFHNHNVYNATMFIMLLYSKMANNIVRWHGLLYTNLDLCVNYLVSISCLALGLKLVLYNLTTIVNIIEARIYRNTSHYLLFRVHLNFI